MRGRSVGVNSPRDNRTSSIGQQIEMVGARRIRKQQWRLTLNPRRAP